VTGHVVPPCERLSTTVYSFLVVPSDRHKPERRTMFDDARAPVVDSEIADKSLIYSMLRGSS